MAMEILVPNPAIRNLIREDKIHQIYSMMQTGQEKYGMQTLNQSLATLYFQKHITLEMALQRSANADELQELINRGAGLIERSATAAKPAMPNRLPATPGMPPPPQPGTVAPASPPTPGTSPFAPSAPAASPFSPQPPGGNSSPFAPPGRR
jgi:hypothetical protein